MKRLILKVVLSTALVSSVGFSQGLTLSGSDVKFSKKLSLKSLSSYSLSSEDISIVIKLKSSLTKDDEAKLYSAGAKAINYAGVNSYYVLTTKSDVDAVIHSSENIDGVAVLKPKFKINQNLKDININDIVDIQVVLFENIDKEYLKNLLFDQGVDFKKLKLQGDMAKLQVMGMDIEKIASIAVVKEINKAHKIETIKPFSANIKERGIYTANGAGATNDWKNTTGLDGVNIPVAIVDEGRVLKSHIEFTEGGATRIRDRVVGASTSLHSTHVAGIIGAQGVRTDAKGIAESAQVFSFCYNNISFANSISTLYSRFGILVSNHSYGYADKSDLGVYNSDAASEDRLVYNNPYINVFMAAGNDRAYGDYPEVGIIKGAANAKNIFTIGALNSNLEVAYYTSTGPVRDYRIKPDLAVRGSYVYSTSSNGGYTNMTGTSMASPAAMALATLVMQEYKNITDCGNGIGCDMRHDLLKAVLIDGAIDKGVKGPDVYTGYGLIDVQKSVNAIKSIKEDDKKQVKLDIVGKGAVKEYRFTKDTSGRFTATLSWVDPAGNSASSGKSLVNDLDIYLLNIDTNTKYYPYSLDKSDVTAPALSDRRNDVDNTEKIEVSDLPSGNYKLVVEATHIQSSTQEFAIASNSKIFDRFSSSISLKEDLAVDNFAKVMLESIY